MRPSVRLNLQGITSRVLIYIESRINFSVFRTSDVQMRDANEDDEDAIIDRYNLEDYGDDDEDDGGAALDFANLTVYASNEEDPYLDRTHNEVCIQKIWKLVSVNQIKIRTVNNGFKRFRI